MLRRSVSLLAPFRRHSSVSIMNSNRVVVNVREGKLIGIIDENIHGGNYIAFRGIPYAKPPVGELRFKVSAKRFWHYFILRFSLTIIFRNTN